MIYHSTCWIRKDGPCESRPFAFAKDGGRLLVAPIISERRASGFVEVYEIIGGSR
ncbi:MAG: hypothetical protein UY16_C0069G0002 [Candidatus Gottesmanbacteria bacterium GW2011_GWA2_47_9]|uniref:Uncharacterized protein n=1 Tax=Candidatus Gottesmanbacteria bacterium GW2011_GWA2_47_9 TaxID=1618445 RepID=A0A0G1W5V0_9BACT|nr:MAG: hypothetical protein UY16_C0069G0002 [Candidatus Gottesmanbacteria bacterium GW2011_GWA2_47_9]